MITGLLIAARGVHFAACLLVLGVVVLDRLMARVVRKCGGMEGVWRRTGARLLWTGLGLALVSWVVWLVCLSASFNDLPLGRAIEGEAVRKVLMESTFGAVWRWRVAAWGVAAVLGSLRFGARGRMAAGFAGGAMGAAGILAGSLVWAGHGMHGPWWHRGADVVHLVAAGIWPGGLAAFAGMFIASYRVDDADVFRYSITRRFSAISVAMVLLLTASGLLNSLYLVGSFGGMVSTAYGRWLLVKLAVFVVLLVVAGVNFWVLKPVLGVAEGAEMAGRKLMVNVWVEMGLAAGIMGVVGVLGMLPHPGP